MRTRNEVLACIVLLIFVLLFIITFIPFIGMMMYIIIEEVMGCNIDDTLYWTIVAVLSLVFFMACLLGDD